MDRSDPKWVEEVRAQAEDEKTLKATCDSTSEGTTKGKCGSLELPSVQAGVGAEESPG